jgi:hypothetical protein
MFKRQKKMMKTERRGGKRQVKVRIVLCTKEEGVGIKKEERGGIKKEE